MLESVVRELRAQEEWSGRLEERVLEQIRSETAIYRRKMRRRRIIGVSLAAAAALALWFVGVSSPRAASVHPVRFTVRAPESSGVSLVGDFNNWNPGASPLRKVNGSWTVTLPLRPGRYRYTFVVGGRTWLPDPARPAAPADDFGRPTSVITVLN
ncbi:MAG: isoamylase early set domain-containing protein [Gemmatimonadota bacterium]